MTGAPDDQPGFTLQEESEVVAWVFEELRAGSALDMLEVDMVVKSLMAVMQGQGEFLVPWCASGTSMGTPPRTP